MAKYTYQTEGDLDLFLDALDRAVMSAGVSVSMEEFHDFSNHTAVRVYERYSYTGKNRLSLTLVVTEREGVIDLVALSSGGSQAVFFKINRIGEFTFLNDFIKNLEQLPKSW